MAGHGRLHDIDRQRPARALSQTHVQRQQIGVFVQTRSSEHVDHVPTSALT